MKNTGLLRHSCFRIHQIASDSGCKYHGKADLVEHILKNEKIHVREDLASQQCDIVVGRISHVVVPIMPYNPSTRS
jgi:hypothetical protein